MLFSSINDKSSKYTANKYGLNTPPCLTPLDTCNGSDQRWALATLKPAALPLSLFSKYSGGATNPVTEQK